MVIREAREADLRAVVGLALYRELGFTERGIWLEEEL